MREMSDDHLYGYLKKHVDNTETSFIYKTFSNVGKEGILHSFIKGIYINPTLHTENFLLKFGNVSRKLTNTKTTG